MDEARFPMMSKAIAAMSDRPAPLTLVDFLLARITEDESDARDEQHENIPTDCWGPERVLAECEVKRQIVAAHPHASIIFGGVEHWPHALRAVAAVYADHPDYREEWRP